MLRPKVLPQILQQALSNGVNGAMIITMGGDLLATATHGNPNDKLVGAIAVNIWSSYAKNSEDLNFVLVDCEDGKFAIAKLTKFLLCFYGDNTADLGMLKLKVETVQKYLNEELKRIFT